MNLQKATNKVTRRIFAIMKWILTVGQREVFWCDSHKWLCFCCHKFRNHYIHGEKNSYKNVAWVFNKWGGLWFWNISQDFDSCILAHKRKLMIMHYGEFQYLKVPKEHKNLYYVPLENKLIQVKKKGTQPFSITINWQEKKMEEIEHEYLEANM